MKGGTDTLTVHKIQENEFENVILPMTMSHFIMLSLAQLYYIQLLQELKKTFCCWREYGLGESL